FWINLRADMGEVATSSGVHICLRAKSAAEVDAFHAAALDAGGRSDGGPGLRPHDRVRYYAAFIIDPDGNRIEAVSFLSDVEASVKSKPAGQFRRQFLRCLGRAR